MIDLGKYETCVCQRRAFPNNLCDSNLSFEEKGKKVKITLRTDEEAKALAIDQCVCTDNRMKCDGIFLFRKNNRHWIIEVELKGKDIEHAFEQLSYMQKCRPEYKEIEALFMNGQKGKLTHEAFIVSNYIPTKIEKVKLEDFYRIRVKALLHSEATTPVLDIRKYL